MRSFHKFGLMCLAASISIGLAISRFILAPFLYFAERLPTPRLPTLASVADLIAPARTAFQADRFESQYMKRAAPRGC